MIEVSSLTKKYGAHTAVDDLSFTIEEGHIYGFLGPNGAGKSTTMNIMTGCLAATSGSVVIDGHDIFEEPVQAKSRIGYLPEQPPLYPDMTPREYLMFAAEAKGVRGDSRATQTEEVMRRTQITDVADRLIKNLSKGYRQRVGIAQALLGNPSVIILDEPTVGLDPGQIIEIRSLITSLGRTHTIVLSSHILSEVQAVCDRIMIISKGKLVANDTPEKLEALFVGTAQLKFTVKCDMDTAAEVLSKLKGASVVSLNQSGLYTDAVISFEPELEMAEDVFFVFAGAGLPVVRMNTEKASLEDIFIELTRNGGNAAEPLEAKPGDAAAENTSDNEEEAI
ncbi:MAG: ABC transporter ATP-binding protein [Candidatus Ornithomonoglobus sp.]